MSSLLGIETIRSHFFACRRLVPVWIWCFVQLLFKLWAVFLGGEKNMIIQRGISTLDVVGYKLATLLPTWPWSASSLFQRVVKITSITTSGAPARLSAGDLGYCRWTLQQRQVLGHRAHTSIIIFFFFIIFSWAPTPLSRRGEHGQYRGVRWEGIIWVGKSSGYKGGFHSSISLDNLFTIPIITVRPPRE